ncbi:BMC domain-containing protein [Acetobacterium carbinolicum]
MEKGEAVAIVECNGLPTAIAFLDTALKSANVKLLGMELAKGEGMVDVKLIGAVSAVNAAIDAGIIIADTIGGIIGKIIIPRPHDNISCLLENEFVMHNLMSQEIGGSGVQSTLLSDNQKIENDIAVNDYCKHDSIVIEKLGIGLKPNDKEIHIIETICNETKLDANDRDVLVTLEKEYSCNLCKDPDCTRIKGRPHIECLHYNEKR